MASSRLDAWSARRSRIARTLHAWIVTAVLSFLSGRLAESAPPPDAMVQAMTEAIRKHCPGATIGIVDDAFVAKHETMTFTLHSRYKTGEVSPETFQQEGPKYKGFILRVSLHDGPYEGQLKVPTTHEGPYYPTFIDAPATEDGKKHFQVRLSYDHQIDPGLKQALFEAIPKTRFPQPGADDKARVALEPVRLAGDGRHFVLARSGARFTPWGVNYDHDASGRLLEDYWESEWASVAEDFAEMKALGANVVRVHLQVARFMRAPDAPDAAALARLGKLLALAESTGLYLDVTGLGCYHRKDVPAWYDALPEADRWAVQARFWEAVAGACAASPAVFCHDLMNEPVLPGGEKKETSWLGDEFAGKCFVQRIALDLAGRTREQVAKAWVGTLVAAIRKAGDRHLVTVGVIPWAHYFPGAKPVIHSKEAGGRLDFVSVHFYPKKGEVDKAIAALKVYDVGKPLVVEEMFPMHCSLEELDAFVEASRGIAEGWIGFYWGKGIDAYKKDGDLNGAIMAGWLEYFQKKALRMQK